MRARHLDEVACGSEDVTDPAQCGMLTWKHGDVPVVCLARVCRLNVHSGRAQCPAALRCELDATYYGVGTNLESRLSFDRELWWEKGEEYRVAMEVFVLYDIQDGCMRRRDIRNVDVRDVRDPCLLYRAIDAEGCMLYVKTKCGMRRTYYFDISYGESETCLFCQTPGGSKILPVVCVRCKCVFTSFPSIS